MIIQNRTKAGWSLIRSCRHRMAAPKKSAWRAVAAPALILICAALAVVAYQHQRVPDIGPSADPQPIKIETPRPPITPAAVSAAPIPKSGPEKTLLPDPSPQATRPIDETDMQNVAAAAAIQPLPKSAQPKAQDTPSGEPAPSQDDAIQSGDDPRNAPAVQDPPDNLGKLIVKPGDTLVNLVGQVYGAQKYSYLRAVIETNPHIVDPNIIDIGNVLHFPPLPQIVQHPQPAPFRISVGRYATLPEAIQHLYNVQRSTQIPVQMIPTWRAADGLQFYILVDKLFRDKTNALDYAAALPRAFTGPGTLLPEWPIDMVFYANPYPGAGQ